MGGAKCLELKLACIGLLLTTSGCVTVDLPDKRAGAIINPNASADPATYARAMDHLLTARRTLLSHSRTMETVDATTRVAVMVGIAGAGIVASTKTKPARDIGKFLTGASVGYMANRSIAPVAITQVYRAGVTNLECIRAAALVAHGDVDGLKFEIAANPNMARDVETAIYSLEAEIVKIQYLPLTVTTPAAAGRSATKTTLDTTELQAPIQQTLAAIKNAQQALRALRRFNTDAANDSLVGERVLAGVDGTMAIVNQQVLARTPDVEAIYQYGAIFARMLTQGADWATDIAAARTKLASALAGTQSDEPSLAERKEALVRAQIALRVALNHIPDLSVDAGLARISQCRTLVAVLEPVTVSPNPIALTAGGDAVTVKLGGRAPHVAQDLPDKVSFDPFNDSVKAGDTAAAGSYSVHFVDTNGIASPDVPLTIAAKPAAPAPAAVPAPAPGAPAPAAPAAPAPAPAAGGGAVAGGPPPTPKID